jgi:hypothetical protein
MRQFFDTQAEICERALHGPLNTFDTSNIDLRQFARESLIDVEYLDPETWRGRRIYKFKDGSQLFVKAMEKH